jgi:hypothetical protein
MTEADWQSCADPGSMLFLLQGRASERKLRLFACGCCRGVWHLIDNPHCRAAVWVAERLADGQATEEERATAEQLAQESLPVFGDANRAATCAVQADASDAAAQCSNLAAEFLSHTTAEAAKGNARAAGVAGAPEAERVAAWARYDAIIANAYAAERAWQADLLRELYPTSPSAWPAPFPSESVDRPGDFPAAVMQLAEALYAGGDCAFALHDALLEVGHPDLAEHFRDPAHPRGCWAIDGILGRP